MRRLAVLLATIFACCWLPTAAAAEVPPDARVEAAVKAWQTSPLYVAPLNEGAIPEERAAALIARMRAMPVAVYAAVIPSGEYFPEGGDTARLAGWLAAANGKPGVYVVVGDDATGVAHLVTADAPSRSWQTKEYTPAGELESYLDQIDTNAGETPRPARTKAYPSSPEPPYEPEEFTVGAALANGFGGLALGAIGGVILAGLLLAIAAFWGGRR
ncbi:hypothetical protein OG394_27660 [Kribbella sp. NBC_01245]|uniref:hypothetical protein n=1 Tax=Kribbella sp. NBC_01245 TaxID=2903578 RepID=UPI002E28641F|nr:hypothetical protein [Kribbella sp. NBC_01245]